MLAHQQTSPIFSLPKELILSISLSINNFSDMVLLSHYFCNLITDSRNLIWSYKAQIDFPYFDQSTDDQTPGQLIDWKEKYKFLQEMEVSMAYFIKFNNYIFKNAFYENIIQAIKQSNSEKFFAELKTTQEIKHIYASLMLVNRLNNKKLLKEIYESAKTSLSKLILTVACQRSLTEILELQTAEGITDDQLLRLAIKFGHIELTKNCLETKKMKADTLCMLVDACAFGHLSIVQYLINRGAEFNSLRIFSAMFGSCLIGLHQASNSNSTVFHFNLSLIKYLIEKGINTEWENEYDDAGIDEWGNEEIARKKFKAVFTTLTTACNLHCFPLVEYLLDKNINLNCLNTALGVAVSINDYQIVNHLINKGADINSAVSETGPTLFDSHWNYFFFASDEQKSYHFTVTMVCLFIKKISSTFDFKFNELEHAQSYIKLISILTSLFDKAKAGCEFDMYQTLIFKLYISALYRYCQDLKKIVKSSEETLFADETKKTIKAIKFFSNYIQGNIKQDDLTPADMEKFNYLNQNPMYVFYQQIVVPIVFLKLDVDEAEVNTSKMALR